MPDKRNRSLDEVVKKLVEETGITEGEALELIFLIGLNWSSLVREARTIKADLHPFDRP